MRKLNCVEVVSLIIVGVLVAFLVGLAILTIAGSPRGQLALEIRIRDLAGQELYSITDRGGGLDYDVDFVAGDKYVSLRFTPSEDGVWEIWVRGHKVHVFFEQTELQTPANLPVSVYRVK